MKVIDINVVNILIIWAAVVLFKFAGNVFAALFHTSPVGQGASLVAA